MKVEPTVSDGRGEVAIKRKTGGKGDFKLCGLRAQEDGRAGFTAGTAAGGGGGVQKGELGRFVQQTKLLWVRQVQDDPKANPTQNLNTSPAPVQALCKRQRNPLRELPEAPA